MRNFLLSTAVVAVVALMPVAQVGAGTCSTGEYNSCVRCCNTNANIKNSPEQCRAQCLDYKKNPPFNPVRKTTSARSASGESLGGRTKTYIGGNGLPFTVQYNKDGSLYAKSGNGTASGGTWSVSGGKVCHHFSNPNWTRNSCKPL